MKILGICGSLRKESYNLKLLKNFGDLISSPHSFEIATINLIPLFNEDVEVLGVPESVNSLCKKILDAGAVVIACPEYNYSISGVLKNALDWVSRHPQKPLAGKKTALMGASMGRFGTARAQYHLRQVGVFIDMRFLNRPEIMLSEAHNKFDASGKLTDNFAHDLLKKLVNTLTAQPE